MKLFLTSAGFSNKSIRDAFTKLAGKPFNELNLAFIPTAANYEPGDKSWLINDLEKCIELGFKTVDIVDISALPKDKWLPRIQDSDVLLLGGGNTLHLMNWVQESGLKDLLSELLKTKIYMGISAGSCIAGPTVYNSVQNLFDETYHLEIKDGLKLVDFQFIPHLNSNYFKKLTIENLEEASKDITESVYALDDNSALSIENGRIEIISEGVWKRFN